MKRFLTFTLALATVGSVAVAQKSIPHAVRIFNEATVRRTEIVIPQVKGFTCYKGDFHIHTSYSDGQVNPNGRVIEAWRDGLDVIAITDHYE
ncbi:MAG: histidinol-phosphatase, partial [Alistipes sp.]|nr:histidinol-phosphatase [Alistipes sp.]